MADVQCVNSLHGRRIAQAGRKQTYVDGRLSTTIENGDRLKDQFLQILWYQMDHCRHRAPCQTILPLRILAMGER